MNEQLFNVKLVKEVEKYPVLYNYTLPGYSRKDLTEKAWNEVGKAVQTTGAECKGKWKNIRAVFVRHMKPPLRGSGSKKKKPYYLAEMMQFTLPYIKALTATTGNLPQPNISIEDEEEDEQSDNDTEECASAEQDSLSPPTPPPLPPISKSAIPHSRPQQPDLTKRHSQPATPQPNKKRDFKNDIADKAFAEYLQVKKLKVAPSSDYNANPNPKRESLKMFLLSMLPDLESMSDGQVRKFKRKCLHSIDEILNEQATASSSPSTLITHLSSSQKDLSTVSTAPCNSPDAT